MTSSSGIAKKARPPDPRRPAHLSPSVHIHIAASLQQSKDYTYVEKVQDVRRCIDPGRFSSGSWPTQALSASPCPCLSMDMAAIFLPPRECACAPVHCSCIPTGLPTGERLPDTDRISSNRGRTGGWETMPLNPRHHQAGFGLGWWCAKKKERRRRRRLWRGGTGNLAWCG